MDTDHLFRLGFKSVLRSGFRGLIAGLLLFFASVAQPGATPLFMTHHSPVGAWASLTFGLPGGGVGIEMETPGVNASGDLLVACSRGEGRTDVFPFFTSDKMDDYEGRIAGNASPKAFRKWTTVPAANFARRLTPATDEFEGAGIRMRVISPRAPLPSRPSGDAFELAALPALLIEVEIDNTAHDVPATGFIGLSYKGVGRMRALDWAGAGLAGVGFQDRWALAALESDGVFTIRAGSVGSFVEKGVGVIHPGGNEGGIGFRVPPRSKRALTAAFAFYRAGTDVAQGVPGSRYSYTSKLKTVEDAARAALACADRLRAAGRAFDEKLSPAGADPLTVELLAQASQAYYANTSLLLDKKGAPHWSVCEGQFAWRNTLDLAADHLPFELAVHPWVAGNVIDGFIKRYTYRDRIRFEGVTGDRHGGISFTHDQGNYTAFSPHGNSGYEQPDRDGVYSFMTTEQLLNGAFCAAGYALRGGERGWSRRRLPVAREILASLENREHYDQARRNGILLAQSDRVGTGGEITTYDALDHSLKNSRGNIYIVVKTWASAVMLERWFANEGDRESAGRAAALATRSAASLVRSFDAGKGVFPANLLEGGDAIVIAGLEPLAVPLFCGLEKDLRRHPELIGCLRAHGRTALRRGNCVDADTGGLRLSSTSVNTWPSKAALTFAVIGWLEGRAPREVAPEAFAQMARWMQVSAARATVSDQIDASNARLIGASYYPRVVTMQTLLPMAASGAKSPAPAISD